MQKKTFKKNTGYTQTLNLVSGYTIIETMIAVAVFLIVIIAGMSALLSANYVHNKSENFRSIMDSLNFIMEDMSRNIRVGYDYHCGDSSSIETPQSCETSGILYFEEASGETDDPTDQWGYKIENNGSGTSFNIYKTTTGGTGATPWVQLNSSNIEMDNVPPFSVLGAEGPSEDSGQPMVTIRLVGRVHYKDTEIPFSLQTTVSQRSPDANY